MKKILVLNFFPAFTPPASGGELRYYYLYKNLSKYFDITLLSPTYNDSNMEIVEHSSTFREYRIPKEDIHNKIHWKLEQESFSSEFSALTCAYSGEYPNEYHKYYLKLYPDSDIIIHEFPYMLHYDLFFGIDNKPRIYNSYNLEYELLAQIYKGPNAKKHLEYIFNLENILVQKTDLIFATSEEERSKFANIYNVTLEKIKLAPNGISPEDYLNRDDNHINKKTALFIGSGHPPNIEAVNFIIDNLAEECPEITFLIAGSCCDNIRTNKKNVLLLGKVSDEEKKALFRTSDIAINPMFSGGGTNLKTLEYLSAGIPMISTSVGVRGINVEDGKHYILADKNNFASKLKRLSEDEMLKKNISKAAQQHINEKYSWSTIAKSVSKYINSIEEKNNKTLLLLNTFEISSPFGGGEVRINKLYSEVSRSYNVLLLCLNNENKIKKTWITDNFLEVSIPKTKEHIKEENKINARYWISATDIVTAYMIEKNELFKMCVKSISKYFDVIVLSHPYMANALKNVNYKYLIYESHNCEYRLKKELLSGHPDAEKLLAIVKDVESFCCCRSNLIISVSDSDHKCLKQYINNSSKEIVTIKNGTEIAAENPLFASPFQSIKELFKNRPIIAFVGSAHKPNIDAVRYIIQTLANKHPHCVFIIIGSVCDAVGGEEIPPNVLLFGKLDNDYKNVLLSISDLAINPMFSGSGSNLKLAEYFSWKLPVVTTPMGARGYDIINNEEAVIGDIEFFSDNIKKIIEDKAFAKKLGINAFSYVKSNLDWKILGQKYVDVLNEKVFGIKRKKLLIVTYRYTIPPLGGAEVYMYELIKELDKLDIFDITAAFLDVYDIKNAYHFSIDATRNKVEPINEFKNVKLQKFSYDEIDKQDKIKNCKVLMQMWIEESLKSARKFIAYYPHALLMGGWNFPEKVGENFQVWSSNISEIYLDSAKNISIKGFAPSKKTLIIRLGDLIVYNKKIKGNFTVNLKVEAQNDILTLECKIESIAEDVRPLGVLINSIKIDNEELSLDYCYRNFLKENYLDEYINELISTALNRKEKYDLLFQETRGLNSLELEKYLDKNISNFDVILGHSIPFKTTVLTSKYALKYKKPYILLPHFHFDDEFYHWKSYYISMQNANRVIAFPKVSVELFYKKLNINAVEVPGGGINKAEFLNIDVTKFRKLYSSNKPFFLVLGRKTAAKNYVSVIKAINEVNKKQHICNLVMIGRDEDGVIIDSNYTYYLGEQPRSVVLGALKECYGLITMSKSESFGIVIIEAWALNKPVIVNEQCPAFTELVSDGINGLYANEMNLSTKISYLLKNFNYASQLGREGNKKVDNYTWASIAKKISNILIEVIGE